MSRTTRCAKWSGYRQVRGVTVAGRMPVRRECAVARGASRGSHPSVLLQQMLAGRSNARPVRARDLKRAAVCCLTLFTLSGCKVVDSVTQSIGTFFGSEHAHGQSQRDYRLYRAWNELKTDFFAAESALASGHFAEAAEMFFSLRRTIVDYGPACERESGSGYSAEWIVFVGLRQIDAILSADPSAHTAVLRVVLGALGDLESGCDKSGSVDRAPRAQNARQLLTFMAAYWRARSGESVDLGAAYLAYGEGTYFDSSRANGPNEPQLEDARYDPVAALIAYYEFIDKRVITEANAPLWHMLQRERDALRSQGKRAILDGVRTRIAAGQTEDAERWFRERRFFFNEDTEEFMNWYFLMCKKNYSAARDSLRPFAAGSDVVVLYDLFRVYTDQYLDENLRAYAPEEIGKKQTTLTPTTVAWLRDLGASLGAPDLIESLLRGNTSMVQHAEKLALAAQRAQARAATEAVEQAVNAGDDAAALRADAVATAQYEMARELDESLSSARRGLLWFAQANARSHFADRTDLLRDAWVEFSRAADTATDGAPGSAEQHAAVWRVWAASARLTLPGGDVSAVAAAWEAFVSAGEGDAAESLQHWDALLHDILPPHVAARYAPMLTRERALLATWAATNAAENPEVTP